MASKKVRTNKLTPMDINEKEFKHRGFKGYDRFDVDRFLDQVTDNYSNALDENVDLKNDVVKLNEKIENLEIKVSDYDQQLHIINKLKDDAEKKATKIIDQAKERAQTEINSRKQQLETLKSDYDRLKQEVAEFRNGIKKLLENQIAALDDDKWQHALDNYFHTERFYPFDGSEPIMLVDEPEEDVDEDEVDSEDIDDVNFDGEDGQRIMVGDNPSQQSANVRDSNSGDTRIVFPDDYKDHN